LVDWAWLAELVEMHFLEPLDELDRGWAKEYRADLFQAFNNEPSKLYGAQIEANVSLIWYRKDWFDHEGIKPPESWGELVEVARHFKIKRRKYGLSHFPLAFVGGLKAGETTTYQLLPFIWSAGGEVLSEGEVVLDNKAIQAVEFLRDLVHRYKVVSPKVVSYEWNQLPKLFATGEVALAVGGSYEKAQIQEIAGWDDQEFKGKVGFIPIPARPGEGGRQVTLAGGMVYTIFSQSKNPKAAMEILKIVTSSELMRRFCQVTGRNPTRVSVAKNLDPQKDWFTHETSKLLCKARLRPSIPQYAKVSEQLQMMFENAISGRLGPDEAVRKAKEIIEALI
jgi:ABC-type glycerol-3-phosphate transport system substrate-binding protein